ncbi:MAG TPA: S-adenosylhomocysteine deaminase, partial [Desulfopila sp.]|nr:S-adenosylhomocysteine deaminase [Desulfopila sp.]
LYNIPSHLTYAARGADVIHSFVGGRQLMKNRRLLTIDEPRLLADMRVMGEKISRIHNRGLSV